MYSLHNKQNACQRMFDFVKPIYLGFMTNSSGWFVTDWIQGNIGIYEQEEIWDIPREEQGEKSHLGAIKLTGVFIKSVNYFFLFQNLDPSSRGDAVRVAVEVS